MSRAMLSFVLCESESALALASTQQKKSDPVLGRPWSYEAIPANDASLPPLVLGEYGFESRPPATGSLLFFVIWIFTRVQQMKKRRMKSNKVREWKIQTPYWGAKHEKKHFVNKMQIHKIYSGGSPCAHLCFKAVLIYCIAKLFWCSVSFNQV